MREGGMRERLLPRMGVILSLDVKKLFRIELKD